MSPLLIIGLLAGIPFALGLFLRVHTSALFLSIAGGYLLSEFFGETAGLIARSFLKSSTSAMVTEMLVFLLPILITFWLMRGSLTARQLASHFVPLVGCALLVLVFGVRLLSEPVQADIYANFLGTYLQKMPDFIVGLAVMFQLVLMWMTARPKHHK